MLLIDGARQTGKTYLAEKIFGTESFARVHKFDFREDRALHKYFNAGLAPEQLIKNLELHRGQDISLGADLIFLDQVGEWSLIKPNIFKLFFFDVGILGNLLEITYREQLAQSMAFKGFIAENFVQSELIAQGALQTYSWSERNSEIEFIHKSKEGDIIPIEVKSGKRTRAKSLAVYREKYAPGATSNLSALPVGATWRKNFFGVL